MANYECRNTPVRYNYPSLITFDLPLEWKVILVKQHTDEKKTL